MSTTATPPIKVTREDLNPCTIRLTVECTPEQVSNGFTKAIKKLGKKVRIPGFRPGLAPRKMVEEMLNPNDLYNAAAEEIIKVGYDAALAQDGTTPDAQPAINLVRLEKEPPECQFTIQIPLAPKVELGDHQAIKVNKTKVLVTDEEVEVQIDQLRKKEGKKQEVVDRGIEAGDAAVVNIKPDAEEGEGRTFMIMAGQTFADLDKAIAGMRPEEIKSATLSFPEIFQEKDWAGGEKSVTITIRSVSALQLPELDDNFAKNFKLENLDELKSRMKESIIQAKEQISREMVNEQLMDQLLSSSTIHVSDNTWEMVADRRLREIAQELQNKGSNIEKYAEQNGMTVDQLVEAQKEEAKLHVKRAVMIERIFVDQKMQVTDADANVHFINLAQEYQIPQEQLPKFLKEYGPQVRDEVIFRAMHAKVMDFLNEEATIVEVDGDAPESVKKPAPKTKPKAKK